MISLGLGTTINNRLSSAGFSAEYQAILTAGSGYTQPNATEQALQNQLIIDLKSAGIWAKLDAFYMFANNITDSTGAFARINWKKPTANYGNGNPSLPPISAKSGFIGNGSTSVNLNFKPSVDGINFKDPTASFGVKLGTANTTTNNTIMGADQTVNRLRVNSSTVISGNSFSAIIFNNNDFIHLNKYGNTGSTDAGIYINGVKIAGGFGTAWASDMNFFHILNYGNLNSYGLSQIKMAFIGGDLSVQASTFNTLISNYITAVNNLV